MALEILGTTVKYGGVTAVNNVSARFEAGMVTGVIGPNGSGKTTLINSITKFAPRAAGSVVLDGESVGSLGAEALVERGVRRTFQAARSFRWLTVRQHIAIVLENHGAASRTGKTVGRQTRGEHRNAGLEGREDIEFLLVTLGLIEHLDREPRELPYGTQRNLGLALAAVGSPKYLLLDEPTSGLHEAEVAKVKEAITTLKVRGVGVVVVDHNMRFVRDIASDVLAMEMGKQIAFGPTNEVLDSEDVRRVYLGTAG